MASSRRKSLDALLDAVRSAKQDPDTAESRTVLRRALEHSHWFAVTAAANVVGDATLEGFEDTLQGVWPRFVENAPKRDPGCRAKEAALTALDRLETIDPEPFLGAIRYQQLEPTPSGSADTAGGVRQRALFALFRLCHPDAPLFAGELLADDNPHVRAGVVNALGHYGDRTAAGLLAHKLHAGDEEPQVIADAATALLRACPDFALPFLSSWLWRGSALEQEQAALAFGQSTEREAIEILIKWTEQSCWEKDVELGIRALGLGRSERARDYLLELVEEGPPARARNALQALAIHNYDERLTERVERAAATNRAARLSELVSQLFPASGR